MGISHAVMWDLDGTMWDVCAVMAGSWTDTLRRRGLARILTEEDLRAVMGLELYAIAERFFPDMAYDARMRLAQQCCDDECAVLREVGGRLFPGLEQTLSALNGCSHFIVSNCQCGYIESFLDAHKLHRYFTGHLSAGDTGRDKAYNIRRVMEQYAITSAVYVGDTAGDAAAAAAAGIPFVYARYGFGTADSYAAAIDSPDALPSVLAEIWSGT